MAEPSEPEERAWQAGYDRATEHAAARVAELEQKLVDLEAVLLNPPKPDYRASLEDCMDRWVCCIHRGMEPHE